MALVIAARCSARYSGRIDAELSLGDAVLIIRDPEDGGDGSIVIYSAAAGVLPRNWMPAGSEIEWHPGGLTAEHHKRGEKLEIYIDKVHFQQQAPDQLDPHLEKVGKEKDLADLLADNLELLGEEGLSLVGREVRSSAGPMDILAFDATNRPVIVEVKRRRSSVQDLWQWYRYEKAVRRDPQFGRKHPRGIIVAPSATRALLDALKEEPRVRLLRLTFEDARPK